jgi:hypothetical protein
MKKKKKNLRNLKYSVTRCDVIIKDDYQRFYTNTGVEFSRVFSGGNETNVFVVRSFATAKRFRRWRTSTVSYTFSAKFALANDNCIRK